MISKQLFIEAINQIMKTKDYQNDKMKLWKKYGVDGYLIEPNCDGIMIKIIKQSFGPNDELRAIEEFCYTHNFGRGKKSNQFYMDSDGQRIKITTAEELYDYLVSKQLGGD